MSALERQGSSCGTNGEVVDHWCNPVEASHSCQHVNMATNEYGLLYQSDDHRVP